MNIAHPAALAFAADVPQCHVLLVDDDPDCLVEYAEIVDSLGYQCEMARDARSALRLIAEGLPIGIVVTDLDMPDMDGIAFLDELASRFSPVRPIVPVVVTGFGSLDGAVQAMRFNAVDFLLKPVAPKDFAASLRRASAQWAKLVRQVPPSPYPAPDQIAPVTPATATVAEQATQPPGKEELIASVRSIIRTRKSRGDYLDAELFADPSWDILLDLTLARLEGTPVPVSSACAAAHVPFTTAFRYVKQLVDMGLVRRWRDPTDHRRVLLEIEERTLVAMTRYLVAIQGRVA